MDEVFLKAPYPKKKEDYYGFEFIQGFYISVDDQSLSLDAS